MQKNMGMHLYVSILTLLSSVTLSMSAELQLDELLGDVADHWSPLASQLEGVPTARLDALTLDEHVVPAQMLPPQADGAARIAQRARRSPVARRNPSLASVPFMIGDTGAGTCLSIGGVSAFAIEHPTLTCARLNVSENNSPLPQDRTYVSYRHFRGATGARVITFFSRDYNVDRFTLATERTFWDGMASLEMRLPLERRLSSNLFSGVDTLLDPPVIEPFRDGRQNELGNVSAILKALLIERSDWAISAGLGVTIPTSRDFEYSYYLNNTFDFVVTPGDPPALLRELEEFGIKVENESVYLSPFLSWLWKPNKRFFHQGFLQVEVAANPSTAFARGGGQIDFVDQTDPFNPLFVPLVDYFTPTTGRTTEIHAQTLMRLNLGCGYIFRDTPQAKCIKRLASIFEVHYTTTLQDAKLSTIPLDVEPPPFAGLLDQFFTLGNFANRNDILNMTAGLSANIGKSGRTVVTNGMTLPIRTGEERGFDLEYNLQVQRLY